VWRALGAGALLPARALGYLATSGRGRREVAALLGTRAAPAPPPAIPPLPARPLRIFVSCAESSGETHAVSLVRALRAAIAARGGAPPDLAGLGGVRLEAEGVRQIGRPVERASMGFRGPLENLSYYADLLRRSPSTAPPPIRTCACRSTRRRCTSRWRGSRARTACRSSTS
jgi:hypothetical protein